MDIFLGFLLGFFIWWMLGFVGVQIGNCIEKSGFFSEFENWTVKDITAECLIALLGPFVFIVLLRNFGDDIVVKHAKGTKKK